MCAASLSSANLTAHCSPADTRSGAEPGQAHAGMRLPNPALKIAYNDVQSFAQDPIADRI